MRPARALDAMNFFLADVRDGLGPYLAVYLLAVHHWDQESTGLVLSLGGIAGLLAQTPAGAAGAAGGLSLWFGPVAVFGLLGAMALASFVSVLAIPGDAIDHDLARGLDARQADPSHGQQPSAWRALVTCQPLLVFAICVA